MIYILILIAFSGLADGGVSVHSVRFNTKEACEKAAEQSRVRLNVAYGRSVTAFCVEDKK